LPAKSVAAFAPAGVVSGYSGSPEIETAKDVLVHFEDSAPTDIVAGGVAATPSKSAFQADIVSVRVRTAAAWAAAPGAAQVVENVNW
jgi:hypothetical protein